MPEGGATSEETIVRNRFPSIHESRPERLAMQRAFLEVTAGALLGRRFFLTPREYIIGRSPDVDIPLVDDSISRQHARVSFRNDDYVLVDLGSKNGTFLNDTQVHECPLRAGDVITVGSHSLQFLYETVRAISR